MRFLLEFRSGSSDEPRQMMTQKAPVHAPVQLTIAVCTYNRADHLKICLDSLSHQADCAPDWELLLVDNNSTDATRQIAQESSLSFPQFRYIFEPEQGLSVARNRALSESNGVFIAYIDDDARAHFD